jgi:hypothetical protein
VHLGFLARELAGPLEAFAAREAAAATGRQRVLSRASAAGVASLLARLPSDSVRRQRLDLADVLAPLRVSGVVVEAPAGTIAVVGDPPLIRFALASLIHLCEADALERGQAPEIAIRASVEDAVVRVSVSGGGRASVLATPEAGADVSDAELSVVQTIAVLHGGELVHGRDADQRPQFALLLNRA